MKEFAEIFDLGINFFHNRGASLSKAEFLEDVSEVKLDFSLYERNKFIIYAMTGIKPGNEEEEREAILTALDNNHNFEVIYRKLINKFQAYIYDNLESTEALYIMEKGFWDNWCQNVAFKENKSFVMKKESLILIDN